MTPFQFSLRPPRHPLLRAALALVGLVLLGMFAAIGAVIGALVLLAWGVRRLLLAAGATRASAASPGAAHASTTPGGVIEGEFVVVSKPQPEILPRR